MDPRKDTEKLVAKQINDVMQQFLEYAHKVDKEWVINENELPGLPKRTRVITARKIDLHDTT